MGMASKSIIGGTKMNKKEVNCASEKMLCDLHTHSTFSDGTYTPTELLEEAEKLGLYAIALTDHNGVKGLPEFIESSKGRDIVALAGIEFSVDYNEKELHIIALGVKPEHFDEITEMMEGVRQRKEQSNVELIRALADAGYEVDYDKIRAEHGGGYINRAHIATALTEKGYVKSNKEAFATLLSKTGGFYKEPKRLDAFEVIEYIKKIGAVAILAHPFLNLEEQELRVFLPIAREHGLDGMETVYSEYSAEEIALSQSIAAEYGLIESGGSDFHGSNKTHISMAKGTGSLEVPARLAKIIIDKIKS